MRSTKEKICRLCLSEAKTEYTAIDDYTVGIITGLRLDLNFYISKEPEMCKDCAEHVQEALIFKAVCMSTEVLVKSFVTETTSKLDLKEVYENKNEGSVDPDNAVCFFCLKCSERSNVIPLDHLKEKQVVEDLALKNFFSEMDCSVIMDPVACPPCATFLTNHLNFVANCTASEQKITKYCESEGTNSHGLINLNNVKKHSGRDNMQDDPHFKQIFINIKEEKSSLDNLTNDTNIDSLSVDPLTSVTCKLEEFPREAEQKVLLQDIDLTDKNDYECTICEYKTKNSLYLSRHLKTHEDESSVNLFHCDVCSFKTKHQGSIKNHLQLHKNDSEIETYSCTDCDFKTKHKGNLKSHMILHDKSDARMHKCTICSYQTRFKATLKRHLNVHKDTASVPMFRCKICDFSTRYKKSLKIHLLLHKDNSEVEKYKCEMCDYATIHKGNLKSHVLLHKDMSEVVTYKCEICEYTTKRKGNIKNHLLTHKDNLNAELHMCGICDYKTKYKRNLKSHILTHNNFKGKMFNCRKCGFQTMYMASIRNHNIMHKNAPKVEVHICDKCGFKTKYERVLRRHLEKIHKVSPKIKLEVKEEPV